MSRRTRMGAGNPHGQGDLAQVAAHMAVGGLAMMSNFGLGPPRSMPCRLRTGNATGTFRPARWRLFRLGRSAKGIATTTGRRRWSRCRCPAGLHPRRTGPCSPAVSMGRPGVRKRIAPVQSADRADQALQDPKNPVGLVFSHDALRPCVSSRRLRRISSANRNRGKTAAPRSR